jgi:RHS repeat-associated protein
MIFAILRVRKNSMKNWFALFGLVIMLFPPLAAAGDIFYPTATYTSSATDLTVAPRSIPMVWERSYRSNRVLKQPGVMFFDILPSADGPLGYGWHSPWMARLSTTQFEDEEKNLRTQATFIGADGRAITFESDTAGKFPPDYAYGYELATVSGGYELRQRGGNTLIFNSSGLLTAVRDPRGQSATLTYNGEHLSAISDVAGRTVFTITWTGAHISRITDLAGRSIDYTYDSAGNLTGVNLASKPLVTYGYNPQHNLTIESNPLGESWRIGYGQPDKGIVSSIANPAGKTLTLKADFESRIFSLTDFGGVTRRFILDANGNVVADAEILGGQVIPRVTVQYQPDGSKKSIDAQGQATLEERDQWENVTKRVDAEGNVTTFTYNAQGKPLTITDPLGVVTAFAYDGSGTLPVSITRAQGRAEAVVTTFGYTTSGDLETTTTDGATTRFTYNDAGLPRTVTDPLGNVSTFEYDQVGNLTAASDAGGHKSLFTYDARRNLLTAKDPLENTTTYAYNLAGRLTSVTDPLNHVTSTVTDFAGRITRLTPPAGAPKVFAYNGGGDLTKVTFGDAVSNMQYDSRGRLIIVTDPEGNITRYEYADGGCTSCGGSSDIPKKITDPFGSVTENLFDKTGKITGVQDPLQHLTSLDLDKNGRVATRIDANGKQTTYQYDGLGRVTSQTDAGGGITAFNYDKRGNLTSLTDPEGSTTTFTYDLAGRKTKETRPLGQATDYTYYPNGLLKTVKDAKGQVTTYTYDAGGRLAEVLYADGKKDTFGYDAAGNLTAWGGADQVSGTMAYDPLGHKTAETVDYGAFSKNFAYTYDARGNKATYTSPKGVLHKYTYSLGDRLTRIEIDGKIFEFAWDKTRLKQTKLPNGIVTDYAYNQASWLTNIDAAKAGSAFFTRAYGFDNVGNILSQTAEHGAHSYGYDDLYQLTSADHPAGISLPDEAFTYDQVGNRLTSADTQGTWSHNKNNELQSSVSATFEYDANGNTVKKIEGTGSAQGAVPVPLTTTYVYDARNRLSRVNLPDGRIATYEYDPFGRRTKKSVAGAVTHFAYTDEGLIGEYDATGSNTKTYGWKPDGLWGTDPLYMVEGGSYYFYHNDHLGTPQKLTGMDGQVAWSAVYEAFGEAVVDASSSVVNNLRFPGQYADAETGLHYNFQRFYDPAQGRYTQVDPIGFIGGDLNLYRYVKNGVYFNSDSFGLMNNAPWPNGSMEPVSTIRCHDKIINERCMKFCLMDKLLVAALQDKAGLGFIPIESEYFQKKNGFSENVAEVGEVSDFAAAAADLAKKQLPEKKLDKWEKDLESLSKLVKSRPESKKKVMAKIQKNINSLLPKLRLASKVALVGFLVDAVDYGLDFDGCFKKCSKL